MCWKCETKKRIHFQSGQENAHSCHTHNGMLLLLLPSLLDALGFWQRSSHHKTHYPHIIRVGIQTKWHQSLMLVTSLSSSSCTTKLVKLTIERTFTAQNTCTMAKEMAAQKEKWTQFSSHKFSLSRRIEPENNCTHFFFFFFYYTYTHHIHTHTQVAWEVTLCACTLSNGHSNSNWEELSHDKSDPLQAKCLEAIPRPSCHSLHAI